MKSYYSKLTGGQDFNLLHIYLSQAIY